ncbi:MAG: histidine kinase [Hyphomicrobiales bacterium]|nr:histidine kinase [Hyphomicrobiales bacterium]
MQGGRPRPRPEILVPTLFRFLAFLAIVGGLVLGGMVALVTFVEPQPREMTQTIPPTKLKQ